MIIDMMVDLETLGTNHNAVILSIGAVKFDPLADGVLGEEFYAVIDIDSCLAKGMTISGRTVQWWMDQSRAARSVFQEPAKPLAVVLTEFAAFFDHDNYRVWGNGASFDNAILEHAYSLFDISAPWQFYNSRCFRTLKTLPGIPELQQFHGVKHNALDDARNQALNAQRIMRALSDYDPVEDLARAIAS